MLLQSVTNSSAHMSAVRADMLGLHRACALLQAGSILHWRQWPPTSGIAHVFAQRADRVWLKCLPN